MAISAELFDAIIIGAGPAGLSAATYLGRYRRRCLVLEDGHSRARWIPTSHNIPGFAAGIGGVDFLEAFTKQTKLFGAEFRHDRAMSVVCANDTFVVITAKQETFTARYLLLATGTQDHLPDLPGAPEAVMRSLLRFCPICDGYEATGKRIAVISNGPVGEREADFLKTYSDQIALLRLDETSPTASRRATIAPGIEVIPIVLSDILIGEKGITLATPSGTPRRFDVVYLALGCTAQNSLAVTLGAACDERGALRVNPHQETTIPRLYAAGDVVRGLNQVVIAAADGAIAATDIHNKLRGL
jgi:thioredoxin reductase (NADPH)